MNEKEHLLTTFAEELGELSTELLELSSKMLNVQKAVFKSLRFGIDGKHYLPTGNRELIQSEWNDLLGSMEKLKDVGIELYPDTEAILAKKAKIEKYCEYAKAQGTIS